MMPDQHGFGDYGTETTRPCQSGQSDDQMNEYDSEVAHSGNGINTSQTAALTPIWQFAVDTPALSQEPPGRSHSQVYTYCAPRTDREQVVICP